MIKNLLALGLFVSTTTAVRMTKTMSFSSSSSFSNINGEKHMSGTSQTMNEDEDGHISTEKMDFMNLGDLLDEFFVSHDSNIDGEKSHEEGIMSAFD